MAYPIKLLWPELASPILTIAPLQSLGEAGSLTGNFPYNYPPANGFVREVYVISQDNNASVVFTVTGILLDNSTGNLEYGDDTITGLGAGDTGVTDHLFLRVDSITADSAFTNVSAQMGCSGYAIIPLDYNRANFKISVSANAAVGTGDTWVNFNVTNYPISLPAPITSATFGTFPQSAATGTYNPDVTGDFLSSIKNLESAGTATGQSLTIPALTTLPTNTGVFFDYFTPITALLVRFGNAADPTTPGIFTGGALITVQQQGLTS